MEAKYVTRPAFSVVGLRYRGKNEQGEIPQLWTTYMQHDAKVQNRVNPDIYYGVMGNYDETSGEFDYLAGLEVDPVSVPEGLSSWDVPAATYAVFACTLPTIRSVMDEIYHKWLPQSGFRHAGGPEFEYYPKEFSPNEPESEMFIYIPIVKE